MRPIVEILSLSKDVEQKSRFKRFPKWRFRASLRHPPETTSEVEICENTLIFIDFWDNGGDAEIGCFWGTPWGRQMSVSGCPKRILGGP